MMVAMVNSWLIALAEELGKGKKIRIWIGCGSRADRVPWLVCVKWLPMRGVLAFPVDGRASLLPAVRESRRVPRLILRSFALTTPSNLILWV
jgi:hypothetical protein